jgi:hypothetical protein
VLVLPLLLVPPLLPVVPLLLPVVLPPLLPLLLLPPPLLLLLTPPLVLPEVPELPPLDVEFPPEASGPSEPSGEWVLLLEHAHRASAKNGMCDTFIRKPGTATRRSWSGSLTSAQATAAPRGLGGACYVCPAS